MRILRCAGRLLLQVPRGLAWPIVLSWCALIWFLSAQRPIDYGVDEPIFGIATNLGHAPLYGILAIWLALCAPRENGWVRLDARTIGGILLAVFAYAIADELHQAYVPGRDASVCDLLTDVVGAYFTLRVAQIVGRGGGERSELARAVAFGLFASLATAALATWLPPMVPAAAWL
ncbi:MAG: VanZ family protein [Planctomycetota bacterium]